MISVQVSVERWAAWMPGITTRADLRAWAKGEFKTDDSKTPDMSFLPPNRRRRLSLLSKMALYVAHRCSEGEKVATVFCSRYGEFSRTLTLFREITVGELLSPTAFSQSVHNTASGLFSITNENTCPATAIASCEDTFPTGFLEAAAMVITRRQNKVLLVMADEVPEQPYLEHSEGGIPYAIALMLCRNNDKTGFLLKMVPAIEKNPDPGQYGLEFLRFLMQPEVDWSRLGGRKKWVWQKTGAWA